MATITASPTGGNWSATAAWVGGVVPGVGDDVLLTATSGNITIDTSAAACKTLDETGYTGILTIASAVNFTVAGLKFLLVSGSTLTLGSATTSAIVFTATSGTCLITTGGKTVGAVNLGNSGGTATFQLQDAFTASGTVTHSAATLNTNSQACSWLQYNFNTTSTRSLVLGSTSLILTGSNIQVWFTTTTSGFSITSSGTATVTMAGSNSIFSGAGFAYGFILLMTGSGTATINGANTFASVMRTATANKTDTLTLGASQTITGTLTLNGNSTTNRLFVQSGAVGTSATLTAATLVCSNVIDFMDITGAGAATWMVGASGATAFGDCQGNSGITFTTAATQTWSGNTTGTWSTAANWTSRVPLPQDNVVISGLTSGTVTADMPRLGAGISFVGSTGGSFTLTSTHAVFGAFIAAVGMALLTANNFVLQGRGGYSITLNSVLCGWQWTCSCPGGTYTLGSAFNFINTGFLSITNGAFVTAGFAVSLNRMTGGSGSLDISNSIVTIAGTVTPWVAPTTLITTGSTIVLTDTSATAKTFAGGGKTYGALSITGGGTGAWTFTGSNTFTTFTINAPKSVIFTAGTAQTVTNLVARGTSGNRITITSSTPGTAWTISSTRAVIWGDWLSLKDSTATGGAAWYAGPNSTNVSGNTGWSFTSPFFSASDAVSVSEFAVRITNLAPSCTDSFTISLLLARVTSVSQTGADSVSVSDTVTRLRSGPRSTSDTVTWADAITRLGAVTRTESDAVTCSDVVTRTSGRSRAAADAWSVSDTATRSWGGGTRSGIDAISVSDTDSRGFTYTRVSSDGWAMSDTALLSEFVSVRTAGDSVTWGDNPNRARVGDRSGTDLMTVGDAVAGNEAFTRTGIDFVVWSDDLVRVFSLVFVTTDTLTVSDMESSTPVTGVTPGQITSTDEALGIISLELFQSNLIITEDRLG